MSKISPQLSLKLSEANVLFTILIVWLHVAPNYDVPQWVANIAIVSLPCFFTISAFLYFNSFDFDNPIQSYKAKVVSRTKSLLAPFVIFNIIGLTFSIVMHQLHPSSASPLDNAGITDIFGLFWESRANGPLWYLLSLYFFALTAPVIGLLIKSSKYSIFIVIPLLVWCPMQSYYSFTYWLVNIFVGAYIAIYSDILLQKTRNIKQKWVIGGVFLSFCY